MWSPAGDVRGREPLGSRVLTHALNLADAQSRLAFSGLTFIGMSRTLRGREKPAAQRRCPTAEGCRSVTCAAVMLPARMSRVPIKNIYENPQGPNGLGQTVGMWLVDKNTLYRERMTKGVINERVMYRVSPDGKTPVWTNFNAARDSGHVVWDRMDLLR